LRRTTAGGTANGTLGLARVTPQGRLAAAAYSRGLGTGVVEARTGTVEVAGLPPGPRDAASGTRAVIDITLAHAMRGAAILTRGPPEA